MPDGDTGNLRNHLWSWAAQMIEHADQALNDQERFIGAAGGTHRAATGARERAALAKGRELEAHLRAIELHERAAGLQESLGHPDRAARARAHAEHARQLYELACQEQQEQQQEG